MASASLPPTGPDWPSQLDDLGDAAPHGLWAHGTQSTLSRLADHFHVTAIVGARAATPYGERVTTELAEAIAARGHLIVSGAAYGIDAAAHRAALAAGGATVAVIASGLDRAYPSGHLDLLERIARTGAVLSELPCGSAPTKARFLARNRLIAALAARTVVAEAGPRSGSLNLTTHAIALDRPVGAVPGSIYSTASAGCHRLIHDHTAALITSPDDIDQL